MRDLPIREINIPLQIAAVAFPLFYILFQSPMAAICGSLLIYIAIQIYNETLHALIIERAHALFQATPPIRRSPRLAAKKLDGSKPIQYSQ